LLRRGCVLCERGADSERNQDSGGKLRPVHAAKLLHSGWAPIIVGAKGPRQAEKEYPLAMKRAFSVTLTVLAVTAATACRSTPGTATTPATASDNTWALIDGREITRDAVDKAYRRIQDPSQVVSDEEALTAKLSLLDDLILQDILVARANAAKVTVADSELDKAFNDAKKNIPEAEFQQELTKRGVTAADMREGLRRELLTQKLLAQEVSAKVNVSSQEVSDFFLANRNQFNLAEESYHLAQIVVTPARDQQIANRTGDDAATPETAATKVKMLMERLKGGANFGELAMDYSEDPESAARGGDMGLVPMSRLKQAPPQLQAVVIGKKPGVVNVASAGGAHTLVLVVAHEQAGQRDLSTPGVTERITEALKGRKEQLLRTAYLTSVRDEANITNYLARRVVAAQGKMPAAQPALMNK
jgi:peptidyl-prolyl cis-trans isomerase SurA